MNKSVFRQLNRFSLRTLFVLMTICCALLGLWSMYVNPYRKQAQSLAVVNRLKGEVQAVSAEGPAWHRWLVTTMLGRDAFSHVTYVDLTGRQLNDEELRSLSGLTYLESLALDRTSITDEGASVYRAMPNLSVISLRYTSVSDGTARNLAVLPNLKTLYLTGTRFSDDAIPDLSKLQGLDELYIRWTKISEAGATQLRRELPTCAVHFHALATEEDDSARAKVR
jgi:Leucine-rich repeat (LRR) protein